MLKLHADGVGWRSRASGNIISVSKADLRKAEWIKIPHAFQLRLRARGGFVYKYNGFRGQDKETVRSYLQTSFGLELEDAQLSYKGWNWGTTTVENGHISFAVEEKTAFELPLTDVAQATHQKNEAVIEMQVDDTAQPEDEVVTEMRFFIAPTGGDEDEAEKDTTEAESFVEQIKASGDLEVAGSSLVTLEDLQVQVPRGRYDIELCDKFMKLHGKTNDYKVLYTNVTALYLLPKQDGHNMALSVSLEHPIRQGATSYPHIVFQLPRDAPLDVEVQLSESECMSRFGEKLDKFESGMMPEVVAKVLSAFTKKKVSIIKSGGFNADASADRSKSIRCSLKAVDGFLFPLDKVFYFLSNKPVLVELERVSSVEFNRVDQASSSSAARTFDITVHVKGDGQDLQFVNLQRSDYKEFVRFLQHKKVRIQNFAAAGYGDKNRGRDDEDDDPYMNQIRNEREAAQAEMMDDEDEDSDDEEDEDFVGGSGSDVDEEYSEGDDSGSEKAFKGKKGKKKAKKEESGSGSGSDDDEDDDSGSDASPVKKESAKAKGKRKAEPELGIMAGKKKGKGSPAEKGKKKAKAKKDPDAPKKAMSAYMLWMNGKGRATVKAENPSAGLGEIGKLCGEMWRKMGTAEKEEWEEKANEDKERYKSDMILYKANNSSAKQDPDSDEPDDGSDDDSD